MVEHHPIAALHLGTSATKIFYKLIENLQADGFGVYALILKTPTNHAAIAVNPSYSMAERLALGVQLIDALEHWEVCGQCHLYPSHEP